LKLKYPRKEFLHRYHNGGISVFANKLLTDIFGVMV